MFQEPGVFIISSKWYAERKSSIDEESKRFIITAAKLIKDQLNQQNNSLNEYPTIADVDRMKARLPPLLLCLWHELILDEVKQVSIAGSSTGDKTWEIHVTCYVWCWSRDGHKVQVEMVDKSLVEVRIFCFIR